METIQWKTLVRQCAHNPSVNAYNIGMVQASACKQCDCFNSYLYNYHWLTLKSQLVTNSVIAMGVPNLLTLYSTTVLEIVYSDLHVVQFLIYFTVMHQSFGHLVLCIHLQMKIS